MIACCEQVLTACSEYILLKYFACHVKQMLKDSIDFVFHLVLIASFSQFTAW